MVGGFEIVDYSDSINKLHKKLLTKILLNKWSFIFFCNKLSLNLWRNLKINKIPQTITLIL